MIDLDELIKEARRLEGDYSDNHEVVTHMSVLADALEAAGAERDEWRTEHGIVKERSSTRFQAYQQKKRELRAMEIECDAALARIAELEQSLRSESLGRRVDATLLHEYERRFAEAAKLHRRRGDVEYRWGGGPVCDWCVDEDGWASKWPCQTAVALGLNEGENDD